MSTYRLDKLFAPRSVAIVGASPRPTSPGRAVLANLAGGGFKGAVGVVRLHADADYKSGEYAILLRSDLKGHGLGWLLMQMIIEYARAKGLTAIHGQVLQENITMLDMCRHLGFHLASDPSDPSVAMVTLQLASS